MLRFSIWLQYSIFRRKPFHLSLDLFRHIDARSIRNMAVGARNVLACGIAGS